MRSQPNARGADQATVDGLIRTRYTLDVCGVCDTSATTPPGWRPTVPSAARAPAGRSRYSAS